MDVKFRLKKASYIILLVALAIVVLLILSPGTFGRSNNPCSSGPGCHGSQYYQYLDVLEGESAIPSTINLGEAKMVSIVIENSANTAIFTALNDVYVTLSSRNGYFSVGVPRYDIGLMTIGKKTTTWQITGISDGYDSLVIAVHGENAHKTISISDSYSSSIVVGQPTSTPTPDPTTAPTLTPTPTQQPNLTPTPAPSSSPDQSSTPKPTPATTSQLAIQFTSPVHGEQWVAGTIRSIEWNANGGTKPLTVTLEFSTVGNDGPWTPIATGISNNGSLTWKTPNATTLYVRAVITDSANPPQTASTVSKVEIKGANAEFPLILIPAMLIPAIALLTVLFKRKRTKASNAHVKSLVEKLF
jgi:hypothetical protein